MGGAALDVFAEEPPPEGHPLVAHPRVICTPHLGASTEQAQRNVSIAVAEQVRDFLRDGTLRNAINAPEVSPELFEQIAPYLALGEKLGLFQAQLCSAAISEIEIEYTGEVAELLTAPITVAVLKGLLANMAEGVNMVNATHLAQERGIRVVEAKTARAQDFASGITTKLRSPEGEKLVEGALFHGKQPRIVRVDDFMLEAIPEGPTILVHNNDRPGVVGAIGALFGEVGLNISRMQLALVRERGEAAMIINVDTAPDDDTLKRLRALPHILSAQLLELS